MLLKRIGFCFHYIEDRHGPSPTMMDWKYWSSSSVERFGVVLRLLVARWVHSGWELFVAAPNFWSPRWFRWCSGRWDKAGTVASQAHDL